MIHQIEPTTHQAKTPPKKPNDIPVWDVGASANKRNPNTDLR